MNSVDFGENRNPDSWIQKRILRVFKVKRITNPKNPHSEWFLQIKSKSGFLRFMIRACSGKGSEKSASVKQSSMQISFIANYFQKNVKLYTRIKLSRWLNHMWQWRYFYGQTRKAPGVFTPPLFSPLIPSMTGTSTLLSSTSMQLPPRNLLHGLHHQKQLRGCPLIGQRMDTCVLGLLSQLVDNGDLSRGQRFFFDPGSQF